MRRRLATWAHGRGEATMASIGVFTLDAPNDLSLNHFSHLPNAHVGFLPFCCPKRFLPAILRTQKDENKPSYLVEQLEDMVYHFQGKLW